MKSFLRALVAGLTGLFTLTGLHAVADLEVSAAVQIHARADFYEPLTAQGVWIDVAPYGRCRRPAGVAVEWRPYSYGHWVWTDCGWYWASDEPWGWACYHYGTWAFDPAFGWFWVPDIEWAPAWVYWRTGGGFIGWAPCPPHGFILKPALFVFIDAHRFADPLRPAALIVNNTTIIKQTTQITDLKRETRTFEGRSQQVVVNKGPGVDLIQKTSGKEIKAVPIRTAILQAPAPAGLKPATLEPAGRERAVVREPDRRAPSGQPIERPETERSSGRGESRGHGRDKF